MRLHHTTAHKSAINAPAILAALLALGLSVSAPARAADAAIPSAHTTFTLTDPASSGEGTLGHGTLAFHGKNYTFRVTGLHLVRTSADAPASMSGEIYNLTAPTDLNGTYTSVAAPASRAYVIQNIKGVRVELQPLAGASRLPPRDAANPVTITLTP